MASKNSLRVDVGMNAQGLIDGAKKSQQAINAIGVEVQKSSTKFKTYKSEISQNQREAQRLYKEYQLLRSKIGENGAATIDAKNKFEQF